MKKYITLEPRKVLFRDEKGKPLEGDGAILDWDMFFHKVEDHPKWATTYKLSRLMDEIWESFETAKTEAPEVGGIWIMELDEDAYKELESACQEPKFTRIDPIQGPREMQGWAVHTRLNRQMICFPKAIINAVDEDPRKKKEEPEPEKPAVAEEPKKKKKEEVAA